MKTVLSLALFTLIYFICQIFAAPVAPGVLTQQCCSTCTEKRIPEKKVTFVRKSPSDCKTEAIEITTVLNKTFCIAPSADWAQKLLKKFENSVADKMIPSALFNTSKDEMLKKA